MLRSWPTARRWPARSSARPWPRCTGTCGASSCDAVFLPVYLEARRGAGRRPRAARLLLLHPVRAHRGVPVAGAAPRAGPACCPWWIRPARAAPPASCSARWRRWRRKSGVTRRSRRRAHACGGSSRPTGGRSRPAATAAGVPCALRPAGSPPAGAARTAGCRRAAGGPARAALRGAGPGHEQGHPGPVRLPWGPRRFSRTCCPPPSAAPRRCENCCGSSARCGGPSPGTTRGAYWKRPPWPRAPRACTRCS